MSLRDELRTPFEGSAEPAKRLVRGGFRLIRNGLTWIIAVPGEIPERAAGALIGGAIVGSLANTFPMVSGTAGAVIAGVAAWKAGAPDPSKINSDMGENEGDQEKVSLLKEEAPENDHEIAGEQGSTPQYTPEQLRALAIIWVREAIGAKNGIHLGPLWEKGKLEGACPPTTPRPEFRKALEQHGIKFDQVKVSGCPCCEDSKNNNKTGVKLTDVPPVPKATPGDPHWRPHASITHHPQDNPE